MRSSQLLDDWLVPNTWNTSNAAALLGSAHGRVMAVLVESAAVLSQSAKSFDDRLPDSTKWIITGVIILVSVAIFTSMRCIKVQIEQEVQCEERSGSSRARGSSEVSDLPVLAIPLSPGRQSVNVGARGRSPSPSPASPGRQKRSASPSAWDRADPGGPDFLFVSFGRIKDFQILASYCSVEDSSKYEDDSKKMLKLARQKKNEKEYRPNAKNKLENKSLECRIVYLIDPKAEFMCSLMMQVGVPEDRAYSILFALQQAAKKHAEEASQCEKGELNLQLRETMQELAAPTTVPTPSMRKTVVGPNSLHAAGVLNKMDDVKGSIRQSVAHAQENDQALTNLQKNSKNMSNAAQIFGETARVARWKHQLDRYKWYITVGLIVFDVLSIWIVWSL